MIFYEPISFPVVTKQPLDASRYFFEIDCAIFYANLHELFYQFISWTNWVNSGKFMDNCWISCQVMAGIKKVYVHLIIINLKIENKFINQKPFLKKSWTLLLTRSFTHFFLLNIPMVNRFSLDYATHLRNDAEICL